MLLLFSYTVTIGQCSTLDEFMSRWPLSIQCEIPWRFPDSSRHSAC